MRLPELQEHFVLDPSLLTHRQCFDPSSTGPLNLKPLWRAAEIKSLKALFYRHMVQVEAR